jgi:hypothetical protein
LGTSPQRRVNSLCPVCSVSLQSGEKEKNKGNTKRHASSWLGGGDTALSVRPIRAYLSQYKTRLQASTHFQLFSAPLLRLHAVTSARCFPIWGLAPKACLLCGPNWRLKTGRRTSSSALSSPGSSSRPRWWLDADLSTFDHVPTWVFSITPERRFHPQIACSISWQSGL